MVSFVSLQPLVEWLSGWCAFALLARVHVCNRRRMLTWQAGRVLCAAAVMNDVVVVEVHQHGDGLADDERDPHGSVAIDPVQVPAHKQR